ncbi:MAG: hypothetical protein ACI9WC_001157, partial [Arenicella sp.]
SGTLTTGPPPGHLKASLTVARATFIAKVFDKGAHRFESLLGSWQDNLWYGPKTV